MKKFFEYLGLLVLVGFSFFYTEQTASVVKELDDIMIQLREKAPNYLSGVKEAIITKDTIIPGISGKQVNINLSYQKMRKIGVYNEKYLQYDLIKPKNLLSKNLDKYIIGGNKLKKQVSLIFFVEERDNIKTILEILNNYEVNSNFFVDGIWFEKNNDQIVKLIEEGHNIGNLSYNLDYQNSSFVWMDTIIKKIGKQKIGFCYKTNNQKDLEICSLQKNYTIASTEKIVSYPLINIKKNLKSGDIIALEINEELVRELELIIKYIKSKDIGIVSLETLLDEN